MGAENEPEQPHTPIEGSEHVAVRNLETQKRRRKAAGCLLQVFALQLTLFGVLAWYVHIHPIVPQVYPRNFRLTEKGETFHGKHLRNRTS